MNKIHPTAIVDPRAELAGNVCIGPHVIIDGPVYIGAGGIVQAHTHLSGSTRIGRNCRIGPAAYVGLDPQHRRFVATEEAPTFLVIGDNVTIRETATIHRATTPGVEHATRVGDDCLIMGATHIAHDCVLGNSVTMANGALLAGHCMIGDGAVLGGACTLHQFCQVGRLAIIAGNEAVSHDIPPFSATRYGHLKGYNAIGCNRAGLSRESIRAIRAAFHCMHHSRTVSAAVASIRSEVRDCAEIRELLDFITRSRRGIQRSIHARPLNGANGEDIALAQVGNANHR
jgi:UDP-N-acetylglucosamine acyltransferase